MLFKIFPDVLDCFKLLGLVRTLISSNKHITETHLCSSDTYWLEYVGRVEFEVASSTGTSTWNVMQLSPPSPISACLPVPNSSLKTVSPPEVGCGCWPSVLWSLFHCTSLKTIREGIYVGQLGACVHPLDQIHRGEGGMRLWDWPYVGRILRHRIRGFCYTDIISDTATWQTTPGYCTNLSTTIAGQTLLFGYFWDPH